MTEEKRDINQNASTIDISVADSPGKQPNTQPIQTIELVSGDDVMDKKNAVKIKPFKKYFDVIERIGMIKWITDNLEKNPDKANRIVIAKYKDVVKEMGKEFEHYSHLTICQALKYVLYQSGIVLEIGVHNDGSDVLIMREKKEEDKLPTSYKHWEDKAVRSEMIKDEREIKLLGKLDAKLQRIRKEKTNAREEIKKERDAMYEELRKERNALYEELKRERKAMVEQIKKYKDLLAKKTEKKTLMVEIFRINWKTLEWKFIKGKMARTEDSLLDMINEYTSTTDIRYRMEFTNVENAPTEIMPTEVMAEVDGANQVENTLDVAQHENSDFIVQEKIDGSNIKVTDILPENNAESNPA